MTLNPTHAEAVLAQFASPFPPGPAPAATAETASRHYRDLALSAARQGFLDTAMRYQRLAEALCPQVQP